MYKQHLSTVKAKDNFPYVTLNLEEVKSYDPAREHKGLDHVLTGQW